MMITARLEPDRLEPDAELRALMASAAGDGAVASFVGVARPVTRDGHPIRGLYLDHCPGLTESSLEAIGRAAAERFEIGCAWIVHRCGLVRPNAPIVFAGASSRHRRAAFEAADYLMDRLKTDAVFWKREDTADGGRWIEPTSQDRADRQRWD